MKALRLGLFACIQRLGSTLLLSLLLISCSQLQTERQSQAAQTPDNQEAEQIEPAVARLLPESYLGFEYAGFYVFPQPEMGYALRYYFSRYNYADIFVYPVPRSILDNSHRDIVFTMASSTNYEIRRLQASTYQRPFETLDETLLEIDGSLIAKMSGAFLQNNLQSFTLTYLSERDKVLMKARITMPDNERNRQSKTWDNFVTHIFTLISSNLAEERQRSAPQLSATD